MFQKNPPWTSSFWTRPLGYREPLIFPGPAPALWILLWGSQASEAGGQPLQPSLQLRPLVFSP